MQSHLNLLPIFAKHYLDERGISSYLGIAKDFCVCVSEYVIVIATKLDRLKQNLANRFCGVKSHSFTR